MIVTVLMFAAYTLGVLTILSFIAFVVLLIRYLRMPLPTAPTQTGPSKDELQAFNIKEALDATARLARALTGMRPLAITALVMIVFLFSWLLVLSFLVAVAGH
jgi:hypothetical protein